MTSVACGGNGANDASSDAAGTHGDDGGTNATSDGSTEGANDASSASPSDTGAVSEAGGGDAPASEASPTGDAATTTDGGGASDATGAPAIDFSIWSLQLPIAASGGSGVMTILPKDLLAGFHDAYFYVASDGGQAFMDPATGVTTSGSMHCRSELREMNPDGSAAAWTASGTHTMTVTGRLTQLGGGSGGRVTVAQVFDGGGGHTLAELQIGAVGGGYDFALFYEEAKGSGSSTDLHVPVTLGASYTFELSLSTPSAGGSPSLTVSLGGKPVYAHTPTTPASDTFYFKLGNYDQTATSGAASTTPYTIVEVDAVAVTHR